MDNDYYGLDEATYRDVLDNRDAHIRDYIHGGRRCSQHRSNHYGSASKILDKNAYENIYLSYYLNQQHSERPTGVFFGYGSNEFTSIHLDNKYILKIDLKKCYNNISFEKYQAAVKKIKHKRPVSEELVQKIYFPHGTLQAGLSASNIICDIVLRYYFDKPINTYIHKLEIPFAYSRYYDDMYISANDRQVLADIKTMIKKLSAENEFPINYKKSYLRELSGSQLFNSTIVDGEIRVSRAFKNKLRSRIHHAENTHFDDRDYKHNLQSVVSSTGHILRTESTPNPKWEAIHDEYRLLLQEYEAEMIQRAGY